MEESRVLRSGESAMNKVECEAEVLTIEAGRALLAEAAAIPRVRPSDIARWRKTTPTGWGAAALRLIEGRRKGAAKFTRADRMWLDPVGVEQATSEVVARHKARRFDRSPVVDLCSGIGGDSIALANSGLVLAVDLDEGMGRRAAWNAQVYDVSDRVLPIRARAEVFPIPAGARVHVDPDRRATGSSRARSIRDYAPGLEFLRDLPGRARGGAIKLGPASDYESHFGGPNFEIEIISLNGECKEATIWFGDLADPKVRRRATSLPSGTTWTDLDAPSTSWQVEGPLDAFVFDPDPALTRSGLLDGFALAHGLHRIGSGHDLLTGPRPVGSALLATFEVVEDFPLDLKILRRVVDERGLGPLEIKTRGLDISPEVYRSVLRPSGPNPATWLLIAGRSGPGRAILARRGA
ncbi:class I SAM-dependent methyltransferase [Tundrisphaera lichenicola]|uniref:class I SAM-dependent methyltransferase n=1 Tax=Tundrisphaera lichenicola TaxID=2029860 RepID=UPI003EBA28B4